MLVAKCWLGRGGPFDHDKARELLDVPDGWEMACMLHLGCEAEDASVRQSLSGSRRPLDETCFFNGIAR